MLNAPYSKVKNNAYDYDYDYYNTYDYDLVLQNL